MLGFMIFYNSRNYLDERKPEFSNRFLRWQVDFSIGASSALLADLFTFKLDAVKNLQVFYHNKGSHQTLRSSLSHLYSNGGVKRMFSGYGSRSLLVILGSGTFNLSYTDLQENDRLGSLLRWFGSSGEPKKLTGPPSKS